MTKLDLTGVLKDSAGTSYNFSGTLDAFVAEPATKPVPVVETVKPTIDPLPVSSIPLSWDDERFKTNTVAQAATVKNGGSISNKSITDTGHTASIILLGAGKVSKCRVKSREGVRIAGSGEVLIENSYLEAKGEGRDHADTIQVYAPGDSGKIIIRNTCIVAHNEAATAGMFVADEWSGDLVFENVAFKNGPFGLRVVEDAKDIRIFCKDVFFIGPFGWDQAFLFQNVTGQLEIVQWENVREATVVSGKLIPGAEIKRP